MTDIHALILSELRNGGACHVDRFPSFYVMSIGAHLFNLHNKKEHVYFQTRRIPDTRLHIMFEAPPGGEKTFWIEQFLRGDQALLLDSTVDIGFAGTITEAGFVGTIKFLENEAKTVPGLCMRKSDAIVGIEEFAAVSESLKAEYSKGLDPALLSSLDSVAEYTTLYYKVAGKLKYGSFLELYNDYRQGLSLQVLAHKDDHIIWTQVNAAVDHGIKEVHRIILADGKSIDITEGQSLISKVRKYATNTYGAKYVPIAFKEAQNIVSAYPKIPVTKEDDDITFLKFLGFWIADGSFGSFKSNSYHVVYMSPGYDEEATKFLRNYKDFRPFGSKGDLSYASVDFVRRMIAFGVDSTWKSLTKRVPKAVFTVGDEGLRAFLCGYYSGDGTIFTSRKTTYINASSSSYELLQDIQTLLARLGITSRIDTGNTNELSDNLNYHLIIERAECISLFMKQIGFIQSAKIDILRPGIPIRELIPRKIRSVKSLGLRRVFDISTHSETFIANGILCHNSGWVYKDLAAGSIDYQTHLTLWTATQPARFDLRGGMGRRFIFIYFIPSTRDWREITEAMRRSKNVRYDPIQTDRIRAEIKHLKEQLGTLERVEWDPDVYKFYDEMKFKPYEEQLYDRMLIGYMIMCGKFDHQLYLTLDPLILQLMRKEAYYRDTVNRGSEFAEVLLILREHNGKMPLFELKDELLAFGKDWVQSAKLLDDLARIKAIRRTADNIIELAVQLRENQQ